MGTENKLKIDGIETKKDKKPFINTHSHIFTWKHVPRRIGKKVLPWPFYFLADLKFAVAIYQWYDSLKDKIRDLKERRAKVLNSIQVSKLLRRLYRGIRTIFILYFISYEVTSHWGFLSSIALITVVFYPSLVKPLVMVFSKIFSFLKIIPGPKVNEFLSRYIKIIKFSLYQTQSNIFHKLKKMYEEGSKIIVLPMDMEYMKAGKVEESYVEQLEGINKLCDSKVAKENVVPFVFVDPRRISEESKKQSKKHKKIDKVGAAFFDWEIKKGSIEAGQPLVELKDCLLKDLLEQGKEEQSNKGNFKGIKLYPALGYYPFDEYLLPLYHYCVQNKIPVLTHCVKGIIYYRGEIDKKWNYHPVFNSRKEDSNMSFPLETKHHKNSDLQVNFTHPLNYLVLLESNYLYKVIEKSTNEKLKKLFMFNEDNDTVSNFLENLQLNLAHYGGVEQAQKYLDRDREEFAFKLITDPENGINLTKTVHQTNSLNQILENQPQAIGSSQDQEQIQKMKQFLKDNDLTNKPAHLWAKKIDWFSIISTMMLKYDFVYADISHSLHSREMMTLVNYFLQHNPALAKKILFGTDFYVVRNLMSEKELVNNTLAIIGEEKFDLIARENPHRWLYGSD